MIQRCNSNNLLNYLNICDRLFPDQAERIISRGIYNYAEISTLHEAVIMIIKAVSSDKISKDNFNIRRMLMEGVSEASTDTIEKYLDDSPIKFHLFAYLNEIIFDRLELKEHKREIFCRENEEYLLIDRGKIKSTFVRIGKQEAERN